MSLNIFGIDLASYQTGITSNGIKNSGTKIAIIKQSEWYNKTENRNEMYKVSKEAGCLVGAYHFLRGENSQEIQQEAKVFIECLKEHAWDCIAICDFEIEGNADLVYEFINIVEAAGYPCGVYCNMNYYSNKGLNNDSRFLNVKFWIAYYSDSQPMLSNGILAGWQYVGGEYDPENLIDGIEVDKNYFSEEILIENNYQKEKEINNFIGGVYNLSGKINMRVKYKEQGVDIWTRWYNMDEENCDPYKNIAAIEIYTDVPLHWGVLVGGNWIGVDGSGIIDGKDEFIKGFQAYVTDHSYKTYYWASSPGDVVGYEWYCNGCKTENVPLTCTNSQGTTPLNAIKLRLG